MGGKLKLKRPVIRKHRGWIYELAKRYTLEQVAGFWDKAQRPKRGALKKRVSPAEQAANMADWVDARWPQLKTQRVRDPVRQALKEWHEQNNEGEYIYSTRRRQLSEGRRYRKAHPKN